MTSASFFARRVRPASACVSLIILGACGGGSSESGSTAPEAFTASPAAFTAAPNDPTDTLLADAVESQTKQTIAAATAADAQRQSESGGDAAEPVTTLANSVSSANLTAVEAVASDVSAVTPTSATNTDVDNARVHALAADTADVAATKTWVKLATEGALFSVAGTKTVRFGTGSSWVTKVSMGGRCNVAYFGVDPSPGKTKECDGPPPVPAPALRALPAATASVLSQGKLVGWTRTAVEHGVFTLAAPALVRYGMGSRWLTKKLSGKVQCSNDFFGSDPSVGILKECDVPFINPPAENLQTLSTPAADVMQYVGATDACGVGFTPGAALTRATPVPLVAGAGAFFSAVDLARWRMRVADGPFVSNGDYITGTPGDWARILANANQFAVSGDVPLSASSLPEEGLLTRDAAFAALITGRADLSAAVYAKLMAVARNPANNFTAYCYRAKDNSTPGADGWRDQALWVNRYAFIYDFIRTSMSAGDRAQVENWLRTQAYFFAGQLDYDLNLLFPNRLTGNYTLRTRDASSTNRTPYLSARYDTNGDCQVNASDDSRILPKYAYVDSNGNFGPQISVLSQWYNNRRANLAAAIGNVGVVLGDHILLNRAKRYQMEWLTWAVYEDGSEGEYARSGDYCIPDQGLVYAQGNIQSAVQLAVWLKKLGDTSLIDFYTSDGAWGTEVSPGKNPKSVEKVIATQLNIWTGGLTWFQAEPWLTKQNPRDATRMGKMQSRFMNTGSPSDDFQQLGLLIGEFAFANQPIRSTLLRQPPVNSLPFPGTDGNKVITGKGIWQDVFGGLPSIYFWEL